MKRIAEAPSMPRDAAVAIGMAVIAVAIGFADGPILRNDWVSWDDRITFIESQDFTPPTGDSLQRFWTKPAELYMPVTNTFWWGLAASTWKPSGLNPAVFHAASLLLQVLAAWMVMAIALRLTDSVPAACGGALLFAVHPLQVETVAWACGQKDLLAGLFSLIAIGLFLMRQKAATSRARAAWTVIATLTYVLAMLAKPSAVVVPLIILPIEWLAERKISRGVLYLAAFWLLLALPVIVVTRIIQPAANVVTPPIWQRPLIALDALGFYVRKFVWPTQLAFVYGRTPEVQLASPWGNVLAAVAAGIAVVLAARRRPVIGAAAAISLAAVLPYLGLTPFGFQSHSTVADHYCYMAMLGPALALAFLIRGCGTAWWIACGTVLTVLAIVSNQQTLVWRDAMTLLQHAVAVNPDYFTPRYALCYELIKRNDLAAAEKEFARAISIRPNHAEAHTNLGHLLNRQARYSDALEQYRQALAIKPHDTLAMNNMAIALAALRRTDEAIAMLRSGLKEADRTNDDLLHGNLGKLLLSQGKRDEARAEFEAALKANRNLDIARDGLQALDATAE